MIISKIVNKFNMIHNIISSVRNIFKTENKIKLFYKNLLQDHENKFKNSNTHFYNS